MLKLAGSQHLLLLQFASQPTRFIGFDGLTDARVIPSESTMMSRGNKPVPSENVDVALMGASLETVAFAAAVIPIVAAATIVRRVVLFIVETSLFIVRT